jgi:hypothetical protein
MPVRFATLGHFFKFLFMDRLIAVDPMHKEIDSCHLQADALRFVYLAT